MRLTVIVISAGCILLPSAVLPKVGQYAFWQSIVAQSEPFVVPVENTPPSREREEPPSSGGGADVEIGGGGSDNFGPGSSQPRRAWYLCNRTGENPVHVAFRYQEQGLWYSSGWHRIGQGKCIEALENATHSRVQYFAVGETGTYGGNANHCVRMSRHSEQARTNCPSGFKKLPFRTVRLASGETRTDIR